MTPSEQIDEQIAEAGGWRGESLARLRRIIHEADPSLQEEWKWGTAVFTRNGNVCAIAAFKDHVKVNFFKGASLKDEHGLLNAGLDAKATRAIDIFEGDVPDDAKLVALVREAVDLNVKK